ERNCRERIEVLVENSGRVRRQKRRLDRETHTTIRSEMYALARERGEIAPAIGRRKRRSGNPSPARTGNQAAKHHKRPGRRRLQGAVLNQIGSLTITLSQENCSPHGRSHHEGGDQADASEDPEASVGQ